MPLRLLHSLSLLIRYPTAVKKAGFCRPWGANNRNVLLGPKEHPPSQALVTPLLNLLLKGSPILNSDQHSRHTGKFLNFNLLNHLFGRLIFKPLHPLTLIDYPSIFVAAAEEKLRRNKREATGFIHPQLRTANQTASTREERSREFCSCPFLKGAA